MSNIKIMMNVIKKLGVHLGLCEIEMNRRRLKLLRLDEYRIKQNVNVIFVLKNMLRLDENKIKKKFKSELIEKLGEQNVEMVDDCNYYIHECMNDVLLF